MLKDDLIKKAQRIQGQVEAIDKKLAELLSSKQQLIGRLLELQDQLQEKEKEDTGWDFT